MSLKFVYQAFAICLLATFGGAAGIGIVLVAIGYESIRAFGMGSLICLSALIVAIGLYYLIVALEMYRKEVTE